MKSRNKRTTTKAEQHFHQVVDDEYLSQLEGMVTKAQEEEYIDAVFKVNMLQAEIKEMKEKLREAEKRIKKYKKKILFLDSGFSSYIPIRHSNIKDN
jgi:hypothetical protein